ncbi:MAG: hypothetical protein K5917_03105, partial [Clostridiales bacterium]|nr:hypothetical protein [Clostridiales bacterium]
MKTLLLYFAENKKSIKLCEESRIDGEVDVIRISEKYFRNSILKKSIGSVQAKNGSGVKIVCDNFELADYNTVIIATELWNNNPPPAINELLHSSSLKGKEIIGLLLNENKAKTHSADIFKKRVALAGGFC